MILIDARTGSKELLQPILNLGVNAEVIAMLETDFQFVGNGPDGELLVGVERKEIGDLVSSMRDKRLAGGQVGRMQEAYDIRHLIIEGSWRPDPDTGIVQTYRGRGWASVRGNVKYSELSRFLCSLQELSGMHTWRTFDMNETARLITDIYSWWQKPWKDHRTASSVYAPPPETKSGIKGRTVMFPRKPTPVECWAAQLPGIDGRTVEIAKYFKDPLDLAIASEETWTKIKGLRLGKKTIENIRKWIGHESIPF